MGDMGLQSLRQYRREILDAATRHGMRDVRVFGSMARGDDHENSDVDFLVESSLAERCSMSSPSSRMFSSCSDETWRF